MSEERKIRFGGEELGPLTIDRLYRMALRGDVNHTAKFWSDREQAWLPLVGIMFDIEPSRIDDMKSAGITKVQVSGSGSEDCPACKALEGKIYSINDIPTLPPPNCTCVPWCRSMVIATQ